MRANNNDTNKLEYGLTGYEYRILMNMPKSEADKLIDKKLIQSTLKMALETEVEIKDSQGRFVSAPLGTLLVAKKIEYDLENPDKIDLTAYAKALGENKVEAEITLKSANELFGDIVVQDVET